MPIESRGVVQYFGGRRKIPEEKSHIEKEIAEKTLGQILKRASESREVRLRPNPSTSADGKKMSDGVGLISKRRAQSM